MRRGFEKETISSNRVTVISPLSASSWPGCEILFDFLLDPVLFLVCLVRGEGLAVFPDQLPHLVPVDKEDLVLLGLDAFLIAVFIELPDGLNGAEGVILPRYVHLFLVRLDLVEQRSRIWKIGRRCPGTIGSTQKDG